MSRHRSLTTTALLAIAMVIGGPVASASAADPFSNQWKTWQRQWNYSLKKMQVQWKSLQQQWAGQWTSLQSQWEEQWRNAWVQKGVNPDQPYIAKGFTVEIPLEGGITQVGGLGTNSTGTAGVLAVGSILGGTGDLYMLDTVRMTSTKVPQGVQLPFDGSNSLSLDGRRVVFTSGIGPLARAYAYVRGSNSAVQLTTKETSQPSISGNGKYYALQTEGGIFGKDTIAIGDPTEGTSGLQTIATASSTGLSVNYGRPQISADGRYTAWLQTSGSTTTYKQYDKSTDTTKSVDLSTVGLPGGGSVTFADWSWNMRYLLITRTAGSTRTVYVVDLAGATRTVTQLPPAVNGESQPVLRADNAAVAVATPKATDSSDTNNATDLAWVNLAGTKFERQSFGTDNQQLPNGIGVTQLGTRVPRFTVADSGVANFWVQKAPGIGTGEVLYVRTTLPVENTTPVATN